MIGRILALALVALPLVACGSETATPGDAAPVPDQRIHGDYVSDALPTPFAGGDVVRLTFKDGTISFQATCNTMSGNATWDDGVLRVDNIGGTEMGCPGAGFEQDEWLVDFFGGSPSISADGDDLAITRGGDEVRFVPADGAGPGPGPDVPMDGTVWTLTGIEETDGDSVSFTRVPRTVTADLTIESSKVRVRTGCNSGSGHVTVVDDRLELRHMGFTLMGCIGVAGEVERGAMAVLGEREVRWSISGSQLRLEHGDHALIYDAE